MGGRLDSTNAVTPLVSVITPIAMDHMNWLGDTLSKIAAEKAGIIKQCVPVVSAPQQAAAAEVLQSKARETGSALRIVDKLADVPVALAGPHQLWNAAVAIAALEVSGLNCPPAAIQKGLSSVKWPARFQRVGDRFVIDGAHNEHSAQALVSTWIEVFGNQKASIIFGALRDKEYANMLRLLEKIGHQFFFVPVQSERSEDPAHFKKSTNLPASEFHDLPSAIKAASETSFPILITGSLFLAGEALALLGTLNSHAEG